MYSGQIRKEVSDSQSFTVLDMVSYVYIVNSILLLHSILRILLKQNTAQLSYVC